METLEASRVCRLCGNKSGISINIFDKKESHVRKINAVLPIMVHEMDLLPKHMCHRCSYKLEEFHKFYVDCLKTDSHLKSQLSWMRKEEEESKERIGIPMVHIENVKIKIEPIDYDAYDLDPIADNVDYINAMSSVTFPVNSRRTTSGIREEIAYTTTTTTTYCRCCCDKKDQKDRSSMAASIDYQKDSNVCNNNSMRNDNEVSNNTTDSLGRIVKRDLLSGPYTASHVSLGKLEVDEKGSGRRNPRISRVNKDVVSTSNPLKRSLRPRKNSVNYVATKRKSYLAPRIQKEPSFGAVRLAAPVAAKSNMAAPIVTESNMAAPIAAENNMAAPIAPTQIKIEKEEKFEGRALRPRKGTIDYLGRKRRVTRNPIFRGDDDKRRKLAERTISVDEKKIEIKQEVLNDLVDIVIDENSRKSKTTTPVKNLSVRIGAIPCVVRYDSTNSNMLKFTEKLSKDSLHLTKKLKLLSKITRNKGKPTKRIAKRVPLPLNYSLKCVGSHDVYLRSGKIKKLTDVDGSTKLKRIRRSAQNNAGMIKRNLLDVINDTLSSKKVPASIKLIGGSNVKHYCERCNLSFVNKELFKLHGCYD